MRPPLISVGEWNLDVITLVYVGLMLSIIWGAVDQELQSWKRRRRRKREEQP
jgi:hypothetical protein